METNFFPRLGILSWCVLGILAERVKAEQQPGPCHLWQVSCWMGWGKLQQRPLSGRMVHVHGPMACPMLLTYQVLSWSQVETQGFWRYYNSILRIVYTVPLLQWCPLLNSDWTVCICWVRVKVNWIWKNEQLCAMTYALLFIHLIWISKWPVSSLYLPNLEHLPFPYYVPDRDHSSVKA